MQRSINQVIDELRVWAAAHVQVNEMAYGDIQNIANSEDITYPLMAVNCVDANTVDDAVELSMQVAFFDRVGDVREGQGMRKQHEVESDTLQMVNDLYQTIDTSARWKDWAGLADTSPAQKFVEYTPDRITGWMATFTLRVYKIQGTCDLPLLGYDFGGSTSPVCAPVKIFEDGVLVDTVPSGGTYSYETGGGGQVTISLPQAPSTTQQDTGETLVFTVKDLAEVAFADSQVSVIVVGQDYSILITDQFLRLNGVTQGVAFSRRLTAAISLQDPSAAAVAATLLSQTDNSFTFELDWVNVQIFDVGGEIFNTNYINGQDIAFGIVDTGANEIAATIVLGNIIQISDGTLTIGGVSFPAPKAGEAYVLGAVDSNDDPITVINDAGVLKVPALPCAPSGLSVTLAADDDTPTVGEEITITVTATGADSFCVWLGNGASISGNTAANNYTYYLPNIYTVQALAGIKATGVGGMTTAAQDIDITVAGILDTYATSAFIGTAAILLQRLYAGNGVEIRKTGPAGTSNFGYTDAVLDEFQTYVGANDGFVRTLYNQVGNDWVQTNNALQPKVIDAGTLQTNPFGGWVMKFTGTENLQATREDFWPVDRSKLFLAFAFSCDGTAPIATNYVMTQWNGSTNQRSWAVGYDDGSNELLVLFSIDGTSTNQQSLNFSGIALNEFATVVVQIDTAEAVNDRVKAWKVTSSGLVSLTRTGTTGNETGDIHNSTVNPMLGAINTASPAAHLHGTISPFIIATPELLSTADREAVGEYMYNRISNGF